MWVGVLFSRDRVPSRDRDPSLRLQAEVVALSGREGVRGCGEVIGGDRDRVFSRDRDLSFTNQFCKWGKDGSFEWQNGGRGRGSTVDQLIGLEPVLRLRTSDIDREGGQTGAR